MKVLRSILTVAIFLSVAPLCAAQGMAWTYENPPGFDFKESPFRVPTQIKQALMDNVRGVLPYEAAYEGVYRDPAAFKAWLGQVLEKRKMSYARLEELAVRTADKLNETGREALKTGTRESIAEAASSFKREKETREKGMEAQRKADTVEQQIKYVNAWVPEAASPTAGVEKK